MPYRMILKFRSCALIEATFSLNAGASSSLSTKPLYPIDADGTSYHNNAMETSSRDRLVKDREI